ncbi:protein of unknown function [Streptomyces murinus]
MKNEPIPRINERDTEKYPIKR